MTPAAPEFMLPPLKHLGWPGALLVKPPRPQPGNVSEFCMRRRVLLILPLCLFLIFLQTSLFGQTKRKARNSVGTVSRAAERGRDGLAGPVRSVRTETALLLLKFGKLVEERRQPHSTVTYYQNGVRADGEYLPTAPPPPGGSVTYKYDDKGNVTEMTARDAGGAVVRQEAYSYEFDGLGNWTKMITSAAVLEGGQLRYEPTGVTYRVITYYGKGAPDEPASATVRLPTGSEDGVAPGPGLGGGAGADVTAGEVVAARAGAANEPKPEPAPTSRPAPGVKASAAANEGTWFVILRTFTKGEAGEAARSSSFFRRLGHDAHVVDTDKYPNFKGGLWAVVLGPYSREAAVAVVQKLRPSLPGVYAKAGAAPHRR